MSQAIANTHTESGESLFSPDDYFLGLAQRAIDSGINTRITTALGGEVVIFPETQEYYAQIDDPREFFQAPASQLRSEEAGAMHRNTGRRHICELLWQAGFHASQGRLVEGTSMFDIVRFKRWPNLPQLPHSANTARICALLTRHATTIMLVHRLLNVGRDEVHRVYSAAYCAGIAVIVNQNPEAVEDAAEEPEAPADTRGLFRALFSKISGL